MTRSPAPSLPRPVAASAVVMGTRLGITLKNGSRVAGYSLGRVRSTSRESWITVHRVDGSGNTRVDLADIAAMVEM